MTTLVRVVAGKLTTLGVQSNHIGMNLCNQTRSAQPKILRHMWALQATKHGTEHGSEPALRQPGCIGPRMQDAQKSCEQPNTSQSSLKSLSVTSFFLPSFSLKPLAKKPQKTKLGQAALTSYVLESRMSHPTNR